MTQPNDLNATAQLLVKEVSKLSERVAVLASYGRKTRFLTYTAILGLTLDIILSMFCLYLFIAQGQINDQQHKALVSDCAYFKDVSELPISKLTTATGLRLFADFRSAYIDHDCVKVTGKLAPADPRLFPYLHPGAK